MGDVVNAANSQSALIATIGSVTDAAVDPWSYSLSRYVPPHSKTWTKLQATNPQSAIPGGSLFYDFAKIGWVTKMTFSFDLNWAAAAAVGSLQPDIALCTGGCGWLDIIESVVIQSSSRELYRMTRDALLCAYGDYSSGIQMAVADALGAECDARGGIVGQPSDAAQGKNTSAFTSQID